MHRDLRGSDFTHAKVDERLVKELADLSFTEKTHNVVFIGGPGTGKTHLATALGVAGITQHGKRVRFFSTVELVNALLKPATSLIASGRARRRRNPVASRASKRGEAALLMRRKHLPWTRRSNHAQ